MEKLTDNDPDTKSADLVGDNLKRLHALLPEAFSEGKVDFELLKQLLGGAIGEGEEKYGLNWHGKRRARQLALTPSTGTLRPCRADSVDWDTTQNLMIEGDNLEVLKLLQKSYAGKVKLIYIDPPYNTGNDFIYPDDYHDSIANYLQITGQVDGTGHKLSSNTEASGRFHTDWLNMMFPRLLLARRLMSDDAAIFISIDANELANLTLCMDEIFGTENYLTTFIWEKRVTRENRKTISVRHDYVVAYVRNADYLHDAIGLLPMNEAAIERYGNPDSDSRGPWTSVPAIAQAGHGTPSQFYELTTPSGRTLRPPSGSCWRYTFERMLAEIEAGNIWFGSDGGGVPRIKKFLSEGRQGLTPETIWWSKDVGTNDSAKRALTKLFDGVAVFDTPKPVELIKTMIRLTTDRNSIVLDFFTGSGTTAEAIFSANAEDNGKRRFVLVQIPEPCATDSEAAKFGLVTVADIAKERIRRAGSRANQADQLDIGMKVFKLGSTNINAWESDSENLPQTLEQAIDHLKTDRTEGDILYELLLRLGLDLSSRIETRDFAGKQVKTVGEGMLLACLATRIDSHEVEELAQGIVAWHSELNPAGESTLVFRDSAFADDVAKTNLAAILQQHGLKNVRSI